MKMKQVRQRCVTRINFRSVIKYLLNIRRDIVNSPRLYKLYFNCMNIARGRGRFTRKMCGTCASPRIGKSLPRDTLQRSHDKVMRISRRSTNNIYVFFAWVLHIIYRDEDERISRQYFWYLIQTCRIFQLTFL